MLMSGENCELKTCSRCRCTLLLKYFDTNRKGQLFKLCNNCRVKHREECKHTNSSDMDAIIDCACGEKVLGGAYKSHVNSDTHRKYIHAQNTARQLETQQQLPDDMKHMIKITEFQNKQVDIPTVDGKYVCACKCKLEPSSHTIKRHNATQNHLKRMKHVDQGLDPDEEEERLELLRYEASLNRIYRKQGLPEVKLARENGKLVSYEL
jgi:hypothetical protein